MQPADAQLGEQHADEARERQAQMHERVVDRIYATQPECLLDALAWFERTLAHEAEAAGVAGPTRDELAHRWRDLTTATRRKAAPP
mgnify:CR=1 FL=1